MQVVGLETIKTLLKARSESAARLEHRKDAEEHDDGTHRRNRRVRNEVNNLIEENQRSDPYNEFEVVGERSGVQKSQDVVVGPVRRVLHLL